MDWDEVRPKPQDGITVGANLEPLSVAELETRVATLKAEIERVEAELRTKRARQQAAQSFFKS